MHQLGETEHSTSSPHQLCLHGFYFQSWSYFIDFRRLPGLQQIIDDPVWSLGKYLSFHHLWRLIAFVHLATALLFLSAVDILVFAPAMSEAYLYIVLTGFWVKEVSPIHSRWFHLPGQSKQLLFFLNCSVACFERSTHIQDTASSQMKGNIFFHSPILTLFRCLRCTQINTILHILFDSPH